jgi:L-fuconolactonase
MTPFSLVDAHVHWWDPERFRYEWLDGLPALNRAFLPGEYRNSSSAATVDKMVFVESGCESKQSQAEVDWISGLATEEPRIKGIVAHAPLEKGANVRRDLEELTRRPLVKGVRRSLQGERDSEVFLCPEFIADVSLLEEFGFTFDVCIRHEQLRAATEMARRVPHVTFVLDHFGKPNVREGKIEPWAGDLKAFAMLPNTVCKISGLATEGDWQNWKPAGFKFYYEWALECFGFDRVLFSGDWPVVTLATSYQRWFDLIAEFCSSATEPDRIKLFRTNAERIYRV